LTIFQCLVRALDKSTRKIRITKSRASQGKYTKRRAAQGTNIKAGQIFKKQDKPEKSRTPGHPTYYAPTTGDPRLFRITKLIRNREELIINWNYHYLHPKGVKMCTGQPLLVESSFGRSAASSA
jgi:hypothetical protein